MAYEMEDSLAAAGSAFRSTLARDLPGTGSKPCKRGASGTTQGAAAQPIAAVVTSVSSYTRRAEAGSACGSGLVREKASTPDA